MRPSGFDRAVALALGGRAWSAGAGLVTTLLIAAYFPIQLQGYYYTFLAILALQAFAELGLGIVITSHASHEWVQLSLDDHDRVHGNANALARLESLARFAFRWHAIAGAAVGVTLAIGGTAFFAVSDHSAAPVWQQPWLALCVATAINVCLLPTWSMLEGCNQVDNVYALRLIQAISTSVVTWLAIASGAELWAAPAAAFATAAVALGTVLTRYRRFFGRLLLGRTSGRPLLWRSEILPMQWRVALSWLSGYLTFSLFTPVLFHYHGAAVAGRMGMTWALANLLTGLASGWMAPKAPAFGMMVAKSRWDELDRAFRQATHSIVAVVGVAAAIVWVAVYALAAMRHPFAQRLLTPADTALLLAATVLVCASLPMSTYLRAHKREPLLFVSLASGLLSAVTVIVAGQHFGARGVVAGYLAVTAMVTPFVVVVWRRRRSEWHAPEILTT